MSNILAPTLIELIEAVAKVKDILGDDAKWHGYDDGSLVVSKGNSVILIFPDMETMERNS